MLTERPDSPFQSRSETKVEQIASNPLGRVSSVERAWPIALIIISSIVTVAWVCALAVAILHIGGLLL